MKDFDYRGMDLICLQAIVAVFEDLSVSDAAARLNVSQSTMSHRLDKARRVLRDPLFIRQGRGIVATQFTSSRITEIQNALLLLQGLFEEVNFDPAVEEGTISIAATDYERSLFIHGFCKEILNIMPRLTINLVWDKYDNSQALRRGLFDLAISPYIGLGYDRDVRNCALFEDGWSCFYDPTETDGPRTLVDYLSRRHVSVIFSDNDVSFVDSTLRRLGRSRDIAVRVPSLADVPIVLKGTSMIATLPARSTFETTAGLESIRPPFDHSPITIGLFWHSKTEESPLHVWVRQRLLAYVQAHLKTRKS